MGNAKELSREVDSLVVTGCEVMMGHGTTTLRAELPDRGALTGLIQRINNLGST